MNKTQLEGYKEALADLDTILRQEKEKMLVNKHDSYNQGRVFVLEDLLQFMWRKIQSEEENK